VIENIKTKKKNIYKKEKNTEEERKMA